MGGLFGFDALGDQADEVAEGPGDAFEVFGAGPELSFGVVDELALDSVLGIPGVLEVGDESVEFSGIFAGDEDLNDSDHDYSPLRHENTKKARRRRRPLQRAGE